MIGELPRTTSNKPSRAKSRHIVIARDHNPKSEPKLSHPPTPAIFSRRRVTVTPIAFWCFRSVNIGSKTCNLNLSYGLPIKGFEFQRHG